MNGASAGVRGVGCFVLGGDGFASTLAHPVGVHRLVGIGRLMMAGLIGLTDRVLRWKEEGLWFTWKRSADISSPAYKIFYRDSSPNESTEDVLVLLHGFPTSSFDWYVLYPSLRSLLTQRAKE